MINGKSLIPLFLLACVGCSHYTMRPIVIEADSTKYYCDAIIYYKTCVICDIDNDISIRIKNSDITEIAIRPD